jgi:nucleoside-diphosphate-sugar epimerase
LVTEETNWVPSKKVSGYSESKFYSEAEIWRGTEEGLDAVIVNPSIILGPANWESGSAKFFKAIWDGMPFYTRGVTGFVDARDVVKAMIQLMQPENFETCKNQRYLLNADNISYRELFSQIADELQKPRPKYFTSTRLLGVAWRAATFRGWLTRKPSMITRETVSNSNDINKFDGSKITKAIAFQYRPVSESIKQTASFLKKDMSAGSQA